MAQEVSRLAKYILDDPNHAFAQTCDEWGRSGTW